MYDSLIDQWLLLTHGRFSQLLLYQGKWREKMMLKMLRSFLFTKIMKFTKAVLMWAKRRHCLLVLGLAWQELIAWAGGVQLEIKWIGRHPKWELCVVLTKSEWVPGSRAALSGRIAPCRQSMRHRRPFYQPCPKTLDYVNIFIFSGLRESWETKA